MVVSAEREKRIEVGDSRYLSIAEVNKVLNATLERELPVIQFEGEISQISSPPSGHLYITLKDANAQLRAIVWKFKAQTLKFKIQPGMQVLCHGKPNVYNASGQLQIVLDKIVPAGEGLLQLKFQELKEKLDREGIFAEERKRALPFFPKAIGIVTSPSGAVIRDIMVKLQERMPQIQAYLAPCRVQGEGSAGEIAAAIKLLNESDLVDVIIVARGGGSLEDLWSFNEEVVVRAVFGSKIPIVSGVGHEVDVTLCDMAADLRAPTPTAAAEFVVPHRDELHRRLNELTRRMSRFEYWLAPLVQRVDELFIRLHGQIQGIVERRSLKLDSLTSKVRSIEPTRLIALYYGRLDLCQARLQRHGQRVLGNFDEQLRKHQDRFSRLIERLILKSQERLEICAGKLESINPNRVLARGFAMVLKRGVVVSSADGLSVGDDLSLRFSKGAAIVKVLDTKGE